MFDLRCDNFLNKIRIGKKEINGRFVIPSGIRCSHASVIERYFAMDSIGIITTKSISFKPKIGYKEPIFAKYGDNSYLNAVGLENPGAAAFKDELSQIIIPENKFLLVSIFGSDAQDFFQTAESLIDYADGFELNMSCPHAKGYGLQIGNDADLVAGITKKISSSYDIPVFVKLSAAIPDVAKTAKIAIENGAAGITVTNSIGPSLDYVSGAPVLSNVFGGMSGEAIRPMGIKAVYDIRQSIGSSPIIIGMGGIFNKDHIESYNTAGADFFGIGSALTNLNTEDAKIYLDSLQAEIACNKKSYGFNLQCKCDPGSIKPVDNMKYQECFVEENISLTDKLHKLVISEWDDYNKNTNIAGKFFFIMLPEVGEKPFALFSYGAREFVVKNVGFFTNKLTSLCKGDKLFIRGPYGNELHDYAGKSINFVAGGTGISPVYEIAKKYSAANKIRFFLGGRTSGDIFDQEMYRQLGDVIIATEDGSVGTKGFVSDLFESFNFDDSENKVFINVGPKPMIDKCFDIEKRIVNEGDIWVSVEYQTSCGVGICGKCATEKGFLSCVDGPFFKADDIPRLKDQ